MFSLFGKIDDQIPCAMATLLELDFHRFGQYECIIAQGESNHGPRWGHQDSNDLRWVATNYTTQRLHMDRNSYITKSETSSLEIKFQQ